MNAEALQNGRSEDPTPLAIFAGILVGVSPADPQITAACSDASGRASAAMRAGRASIQDELLLPYKLVYETLRERAATVRYYKHEGASRVMNAIGALRHRQRAAMTLRWIVGLSQDETGRALSMRPPEVDYVLRAGEGALAKAYGEPIDVAESLRRAGAELIVPDPIPDHVSEPARLPRAVFRGLLAEKAFAPAMPAPGAAPAEAVPDRPAAAEAVPDRPAAAEAVPDPGPVVLRADRATVRGRFPWQRLGLAAAFGMLVAALVLPVSAGTHDPAVLPAVTKPAAIAPAQTIVVPAPKHVLPASHRVVVVQHGDSLWAIARRMLGSGTRWTEIWSRNQGKTMTGGERFAQADLVKPGWRLVVPRR